MFDVITHSYFRDAVNRPAYATDKFMAAIFIALNNLIDILRKQYGIIIKEKMISPMAFLISAFLDSVRPGVSFLWYR